MRRCLRLALPLGLAACAGPAAVDLDPAADVRAARRQLAEAAAAGPVPVSVRGTAPLATPDLLRAVEQGVRGLAITAVAGDGPRRFVLDFSGETRPLCNDQAAAEGPGESGAAPLSGRVRAAFCDGGRAVAVAATERTGQPERLIWRLVGRLVPDDYQDSYGFDLFGNRIGIGGGFSF